jgi:hypothetical protein
MRGIDAKGGKCLKMIDYGVNYPFPRFVIDQDPGGEGGSYQQPYFDIASLEIDYKIIVIVAKARPQLPERGETLMLPVAGIYNRFMHHHILREQ